MDPESELLALPGGATRVEWRLSRRARRVSLRIDARAGAVVVTLPPRAGRRAGRALLMEHADWVARRLAALPGAVPFADGAVVPLDGTPHRVRHMPAAKGGVWVEAGEIHVSGAAEFLPRRLRGLPAPRGGSANVRPGRRQGGAGGGVAGSASR